MGTTGIETRASSVADISDRGFGVILPLAAMPTSGDHQGTYSKTSVNMLRILRDAGVGILHDLPLTPPDENGCPYSSTSSFAVDPQRIDLQKLVNMGDITEQQHEEYVELINTSNHQDPNCSENNIFLRSKKDQILTDAYEGFNRVGSASRKAEFSRWREEQAHWLDQYATYEILKAHKDNVNANGEEQRWQDWAYGKDCSDDLVEQIKSEFEEKFSAISYVQWIAERQTLSFQALARRFGIEIWGDVPFYTGPADVWANREVFNLDENGNQLDQGGAPPSDTSADGQKWGNATYFYNLDNDSNRARSERVIDWWEERIVRAYKLNGGMIRLDHFIGFAEPYIIAADAQSGKDGKKDPSRGLGDALLDRLINRTFKGQTRVYPEDLGEMTELTVALRKKYGLTTSAVAGRGLTKHLRRNMRLYRNSQFNPDNYTGEAVAFSSNHDMATLIQSIDIVRDQNPFSFWQYAHTLKRQFPHSGITRHSSSVEIANYEMDRIMSSGAKIVFLAIWDMLHLGEEARYNIPGKISPKNWSWGMSTEHVQLLEREAPKWLARSKAAGRLVLAA